MTTDRVTPPPSAHRLGRVAIATIILFAIAAFWLTHPQTSPPSSLSPLSGLMTLRDSARTAMPYDVAMANAQPTLIEFYADWCTTCQALAPTLRSVHEEFGAAVNLVMLNIDDPQWREQVRQFQVTGVPHLVLLDDQQAIADTFIGKVPRSVLANRIADLVG